MRDASTLPLRLARLRSQHLTDDARLGADPPAIARAVCAIQAQDFDAARHQLRVRSAGLTAGAVDHAFDNERSVVKTWLMRGTLHLCAADDVHWMLDVFGPAVNRLGARQWATMGLDETTLQRALRVIRKTLANGPVSRRDLRAELVRRGVFREPVGQAMIYLLFQAATLGITCSGPRIGRGDSFVLLDDWVPRSDGPRGDAALAALARRYLAAYGPATEGDLAAWSGLPVAMARAGMALIAREVVEFPSAVPGLWMLRSAAPVDRPRLPVVRLLGHFDTFLLGYRRRHHLGDEKAEEWIHHGGGGWIRPVVCVDGWIVGGWRLEHTPRDAEVTVLPFERLSGRIQAGIGREVAAIGRFLERPTRWSSGPLVGLTPLPT